MITNETRDNHMKMLRAIENIVTLTNNVRMGCEDDLDAMEKETARIPAMKQWMNANGTKADVLSWLSSRPSVWDFSRGYIATNLYNEFNS